MTDNVTNRQKAVEYNRSAMEKLASQYKVMGVNGNSYSFASVSDMIEVPMDSNSFYIVDESIPFYQMVIRGYIEFTGSPLNMADDFKEELLKSVETGAGLYFKWIYANNSSVKETDYDSLYSVNYEHWLKEAVSTYEKVNQVFHKLQGQTIINHQKIESEVYKVTYEDGTEIVVNYNKDSIIYGGKTIEGKDFTIVKEGW